MHIPRRALDAPSAITGVSLIEALAEVSRAAEVSSGLPVPLVGAAFSEGVELLDCLPAPQAAMIRLHVLECTSLGQAGAQLGVSHSTAERRVKQGLASLRELLA